MFEKKLSRKIQGKSYLRLNIVTNKKLNSPRKPASKCPRKTRWQGIPEVDSLSRDVSFRGSLPKLETCFCNALPYAIDAKHQMYVRLYALYCRRCSWSMATETHLSSRLHALHPSSTSPSHSFLPPTYSNSHHTLNSPLPWRRAIALVKISWQ